MVKNQELHKNIEHVHREIEKIEPASDQERQVIERLRGDLQELVEVSSQDPETRDESVIDRLYDTIEKFEVDYPDLTAILKKVLDVLSASGI